MTSSPKTNNEASETLNLCVAACEEFKSLGYQKDIHPRSMKESYNISKKANGKWFKSTKTSLHSELVQSELDLSVMPILKKLTDSIDELDPEIQRQGGRIFITENLVYKIKKGTAYPIIQSSITSKEDKSKLGPYSDLCAEILSQGHESDRYRTEETYIISKTASGEWFMSSTHENLSGKKKTFNLEIMPQLKMLAAKINKLDPVFQSNGGRVFITPMRIYRLKNKIEIDFKFKK